MAGIKTQVILRLDYIALDRVLKSPSGMVGRYIIELGRKTADRGRRDAPVASGALRRSVGITSISRRVEGTEVRVSANISYAFFVHEGTREHPIEARNVSLLRFPSRSGFIVYTPRVNHPGTTANPFLWNALKSVIN